MFSLRVLLSICLIFCQFQPRVAYKSVANKKAYILSKTSWTLFHTTVKSCTNKKYFRNSVRERCTSLHEVKYAILPSISEVATQTVSTIEVLKF